MNIDFARQQMIQQQVRAWDVLDANVLNGMKDVPREKYVPAAYKTLAFADTEIPLGRGQKMMTPTVEGRVLQALQLAGGERVLEIGTGSGYLTACLATLCEQVISVDIIGEFLDDAGERLAEGLVENVELLEMDATESLPEGTFDAIVVTGSVQTYEQRFADALNPGGRLVVIVGDSPAMSAMRTTRTDDSGWQSDTLFETDIAPLINGALPPQFSF